MPYLLTFVSAIFSLVAVATSDAAEAGTGSLMVVTGLSAGDLLNIREAASPLGKTAGRLPNGAIVRNHECKAVEGYEWCHVDAIEVDDLSGWTPARYLQALDIEAVSEDVAAYTERGEALAEPSAIPAPQTADPVSQTNDAPDAVKTARLPKVDDAGTSLPDGLEARFADTPSVAAPPDEADADLSPEQEIGAPLQPPAGPGSIVEEGLPEAAASSVPLPTPRPDPGGAAAEDVAAFAPQESSSRAANASAVIPCARHVGQPMTQCAAHAVRTADGVAHVTVVWPDGGSRLIEFRNGAPAGSDARSDFRFTREGTLSMIRIGVSERFEIVDALPFGD